MFTKFFKLYLLKFPCKIAKPRLTHTKLASWITFPPRMALKSGSLVHIVKKTGSRDVKSPQNFHLTSGKRWGDPGWFEITSPHLTKIEVILKSPHLTSKKSRWFQNHLTSPQKILRWNGCHLTSPQKFWGDFKITSPHLEKIEVTLKSPHLTSHQNWKISKFVIVFRL